MLLKRNFNLKAYIEERYKNGNIVEIKELFKTIDKDEILWY